MFSSAFNRIKCSQLARVSLALYCVISQAVKDDIAQLVESQQELEASFEDAVNRKTASADNAGALDTGAGDASSNSVQNAAASLRNNAAVFALALKQHPLATDNIEKVQSDRFVSFNADKHFDRDNP